MAIPLRLDEITKLLATGTRNGVVTWQPLDSFWGFVTSVGRYTISLTEIASYDAPQAAEVPSGIVMKVLSPQGQDMDECAVSQNDPDFDTLRSIWMAAERAVEKGRQTKLAPLEAELRKLMATAST